MYEELFKKYAKREQVRSISGIVSGLVAVGIGIWALRQLQADRALAAQGGIPVR